MAKRKAKAAAEGSMTRETSASNVPVGINGYAPIREDQVQTNVEGKNAPVYDDDAAASLIWQDFQIGKTYIDNQQWELEWQQNDILYQSPTLVAGDNPGDDRYARVSRFTVNNATNTMADACRDGLFAQKPPFFLRPRGKTTQKTVMAWTALLDTLLDRMNFRYWTGLGIDQMALDGTCIWMGGWATRKVVRRSRKRVQPPAKLDMPAGPQVVETKESQMTEPTSETVIESYPWIERRMLGTTVFDPSWRTPNRPDLCGWAINIDYPSWMDLDQLRSDPESPYDIPDMEWIKDHCFMSPHADAGSSTNVEQSVSMSGGLGTHAEDRSKQTSADPLSVKIMMLERWDEYRVMASLHINGVNITIRNDEHDEGRIPLFTANWRNIPNSGYGMGMGKLVGGEQRVEQGVLNHAINLLGYQLNPVILHALGVNAPTQNIEVVAGGFVGVQPGVDGDVRKGMAVMEMPKVPGEAWNMIQYMKSSSNETSGADSTFMQGHLGGPGSSAARTATGAGRIAAKSDAKVQTPVENIEMGLFVPFLSMVIDMVKRKMPLKEIDEILSRELAAEIKADIDIDEFLDANLTVEILAGAKLAAKAAMAQQIPFLMQILQQPKLLEQLQLEGKTIDVMALLDILFTVSEFRVEKDIVREMTQQEMQTVMAMKQASSQPSIPLQVEQMRGQNALEKSDRDAQNKIGVDAAQVAIQHHLGAGAQGATPNSRSPIDRAVGLTERADAENYFQGKAPIPLAGVV